MIFYRLPLIPRRSPIVFNFPLLCACMIYCAIYVFSLLSYDKTAVVQSIDKCLQSMSLSSNFCLCKTPAVTLLRSLCELADDQHLSGSGEQMPARKNTAKKGRGLQNLFSSSGRFCRSLKRYKLHLYSLSTRIRSTHALST